VASLKLLIGELPGGLVQKEMVILRCGLVLAQVVVSRSPQEIANWDFREKLCPGVENLDDQLVVFCLIGSACQVTLRGPQVGLKLDRGKQLFFCLRELFLLEKNPAQAVMQFAIVRLGRK